MGAGGFARQFGGKLSNLRKPFPQSGIFRKLDLPESAFFVEYPENVSVEIRCIRALAAAAERRQKLPFESEGLVCPPVR